jgi:hypothetical protein
MHDSQTRLDSANMQGVPALVLAPEFVRCSQARPCRINNFELELEGRKMLEDAWRDTVGCSCPCPAGHHSPQDACVDLKTASASTSATVLESICVPTLRVEKVGREEKRGKVPGICSTPQPSDFVSCLMAGPLYVYSSAEALRFFPVFCKTLSHIYCITQVNLAIYPD